MDIKKEYVFLDNVKSEFFTMKRNIDDVTVKTEIISENSFTKHPAKKIKSETATCSNNWNVDWETEIEKQTLVSDFGSQNEEYILPEDPVMKNQTYNVDDELCNKIEIKVEPYWLETETSSVCDDIKDGDLFPVKSSRLRMETVSGESPLSSAEVSGTNASFSNVRDHLECESEVREMSPVEEQVLLEQSGMCSDRVEMCLNPLDLKLQISAHKNKRPHKSNICSKDLSDLSHLEIHNLIHEGNMEHQCKTCNKSFTQLSNLKKHSLIHEGKKPYRCETCDQSFTQFSNLKIHNLIHEGKKPYQCNTCDKSFNRFSNLKRHNLVHEGKKPHQCKSCDKSFTQFSHLKRHNIIHERKYYGLI